MASKGIALQALRQPIRGGWWLQLRHKNCRTSCFALAALPPGHAGVPCEEHLPPLAWRSSGRAPSATILETESYRWEIGFDGERPPEGPLPEIRDCGLFQQDSVDGSLPSGELKVVNYLGILPFTIRRGSDEQPMALSVVSKKLSDEKDFERMTSDVARECDQLLMDWNTPVTVPFSSDAEQKQKILLEQFMYLRSELGRGRLEQWMESVRRRPHTALIRRSAWRPAELVRSTDHLRNPALFGRDWRRMGGRPVPSVLREISSHETVDTAPNRFLRHALESFLAVCNEVLRMEKKRGGPAQQWAAALASRLTGILGTGLFREVGRPRRLALENQTLQKREGYRDILRTWIKLDQAARLDWDGRKDVFSATVRNVANLYEYWLFFGLYKLLKGIDGMRLVEFPHGFGAKPAFCKVDGRLTVNLQRGKESMLVFEQQQESGETLRVHFCYERVYAKGDVLTGGAYSRLFRPDFSLVMFPASFAVGRDRDAAENAAAQAGKIACLHFDAKYRVDKLEEFFGVAPDSAEAERELDAEEESKATNTYKRADLYKMHTYNDAIRRTVGSYVLYPGDAENDEKFRKYHELLPGLGAFAIPPGKPERFDNLQDFIARALQTQRDKFSQLARISYWTHDTVKEEPAEYHAGGAAVTDGRPPADTHVVLGYLRPDENPNDYRSKGVFYCHAVEWDTAGEPGKPTRLNFDPFRADLLGVFQKNVTAPWIGKVREVKMVTAADRAAELGRSANEMKAAYYFRFSFDNCSDEQPRDVASIVSPRPSKPVGCTLAQLGQCEPVI
jgi:predicted component of viral defense system (DUF524 family)